MRIFYVWLEWQCSIQWSEIAGLISQKLSDILEETKYLPNSEQNNSFFINVLQNFLANIEECYLSNLFLLPWIYTNILVVSWQHVLNITLGTAWTWNEKSILGGTYFIIIIKQMPRDANCSSVVLLHDFRHNQSN